MSYATRSYDNDDVSKIIRFIGEFPFAILMPNWAPTTYAMTPLFIHPMSKAGCPPILYGHLDRENPTTKAMTSSKACAIFLGPNGYISPHDYASRQFPTWNYSSVEITGDFSYVRSNREAEQLMKHQIKSVEDGGTLSIDFSSSQVQGMMDGIRFFCIHPTSAVGRFKFSQEKSLEDRQKAVRRLADKSILKIERQLQFLADLETDTTELAMSSCGNESER